MIYILTGDEDYLVEKRLNSLILDNESCEIEKYNGLDKDFNIDLLVDSYNNVGLFSSNKLIIVKDPYFLIKKADDNDIEKICFIINNQNFETTIIFYTLTNSFNEKLKSFKELSSNAKIIKCNQLKRNEFVAEAYSIIRNKNMNIDKSLVGILINASNNSLRLFSQNIDVLSLYPGKINEDVINKLLISSSDEEVFNLINALTNKNISQAIKCSRKLISSDNNINGLISLIANQLRFLYEVSFYSNSGLTINDIADKTSTKNTYRIEKAFESLRHLKDLEILKLLDYLSNLDYKLKTNVDINEELQLELFITSLINYEK